MTVRLATSSALYTREIATANCFIAGSSGGTDSVQEFRKFFFSWHSKARAYARGVGLTPPWAWYFAKTLLQGECIGLDFYKNKESTCGRICILCQQTSLESMNMSSNCDVTNSAHQIQMTNICHWMKTPPWKFSADVTALKRNETGTLFLYSVASWIIRPGSSYFRIQW